MPRVNGPGWRPWRQRRDGVVVQPPAKNVLNRQPWTTREQLRLPILAWTEKTYHRRRRQDGLGRLTPIEFETSTRPLTRPEPTIRPSQRKSRQSLTFELTDRTV
jgi:transposase InsO family protein